MSRGDKNMSQQASRIALFLGCLLAVGAAFTTITPRVSAGDSDKAVPSGTVYDKARGELSVGTAAPTPARYVIGVWRDPNGIIFGRGHISGAVDTMCRAALQGGPIPQRGHIPGPRLGRGSVDGSETREIQQLPGLDPFVGSHGSSVRARCSRGFGLEGFHLCRSPQRHETQRSGHAGLE